jgi:6-phosphogluconolactonase
MFTIFRKKTRGPEEWRHDSFETMSLAAAAFIRETGKRLGAESGRFTLGLGGGEIFGEVFERLVRSPTHSAMNWAVTHLFWCEELLLPQEDGRSLYRAAREGLIDRVPLPNANIHRLLAAPDAAPEVWAETYEEELARFFGLQRLGPPPVFDCLLLAQAPRSEPSASGRWVEPLREPALLGQERAPVLAFTPELINAASNVLVFAQAPVEAPAIPPKGRWIWLTRRF